MTVRELVKARFSEYAANYDLTDSKVKLKFGHTYRVASLCEQLARSQKLPQEDIDLAWLSGMLHDIGRFEQLRRYNTFIDSQSVDHARFGADLLFKEGLIERFGVAPGLYATVETAIRQHNKYRMDEGIDERTALFCNILRDADKIDILRVNVEFPLEEIYNTTTEILRSREVAPAVLEAFYAHHAVPHGIKQSPVDHLVGHISLIYELVFKRSVEIVFEQKYIDRLLEFESDNPAAQSQFEGIRREIDRVFG